MKKIFIVSVITLFFSACSFEQDTRLSCINAAENSWRSVSLVFNESQKKFVWQGYDWIGASKNIEWTKDKIRTIKRVGKMFSLDKTSLEFRIWNEDTLTPFHDDISYYNCRVVEGV